MCSGLELDPCLKGQGHTRHLKVRVHLLSCPHYNFRMHWWITIKLGTNVVLIEAMCNDLDPDEYLKGQGHTRPEVTVLREYLGYQSNNWYFLFSHSWPVVVYHFGQFQGTSQVERKTKCSKKNSRPFDCLVKTNCIRDTGTFSISKQRHWMTVAILCTRWKMSNVEIYLKRMFLIKPFENEVSSTYQLNK